jgi:replicative DNA helicase
VDVRRCYDVHSLLHVLDELMQQQQEQQQQQQEHQQRQQEQAAQEQRQQETLDHQPQQQQQQQRPPARRHMWELPVGLLVVDSLSAVIAPILGGGQHSQGHALLATAASSLKAFAARGQAAVLVTNHLVGGSDERRHEKRPAMGESWRNQPHARCPWDCVLPCSLHVCVPHTLCGAGAAAEICTKWGG